MDYEKKLQLVRRGYVFHKLIDPKRIREIIRLYRAKADYLEIGADESQREKLKTRNMTDEELDVDKKYKEGYNFGYRLSKLDDDFCDTVIVKLNADRKNLSEHDQGLMHGIEEARMEKIYKHKDAAEREQILKEEILKKTQEDLQAIFDKREIMDTDSESYNTGFEIGYLMAQRESGRITLAEAYQVYDNETDLIKGMRAGEMRALAEAAQKEKN